MESVSIACLLKISDNQLLSQFLHESVDDIVGKRQCNYANYKSVGWSIEEYEKALNFVKEIYSEGISSNDTSLDLRISGHESFTQTIQDCFDIRKSQLQKCAVRGQLAKTGLTYVENLDWKLKWIMGSSKLASLREPLLQIDLRCFKNLEHKELINFEANLEQVNNLIAQLEKVKGQLQKGSVD